MEIIIVVAVLVGVALWWGHHVKAEKSKIDNDLDTWTPPKAEDKPWPYGEKVAEGKIHVKTSDAAPGNSAADRVEAPAPVAETKPAKKTPAKKQQFDKKPAVVKAATKKGAHEGNKAPAKRTPAKKKST